MRQPLVRSYAVTHPPGTVHLPTNAAWNQLVHASRGVVGLATELGTWVLPPHRAAWVPAGIEHRCHLRRRTSLRTLYVGAGVELLPARTQVLDLTPFARELVLHMVSSAPLHAGDPLTASLLEVLASTLRTLAVAPLQLRSPTTGECRSVAERVRADPGSATTVVELAAEVGLSRRTLERRFRVETGLTLGRWRRRARLLAALELLAAGEPVGAVAGSLGYATQSAFGAMFKAELGCSPGTYFAS